MSEVTRRGFLGLLAGLPLVSRVKPGERARFYRGVRSTKAFEVAADGSVTIPRGAVAYASDLPKCDSLTVLGTLVFDKAMTLRHFTLHCEGTCDLVKVKSPQREAKLMRELQDATDFSKPIQAIEKAVEARQARLKTVSRVNP